MTTQNVIEIDLNNADTIDATIESAQTDKGSLISLVNIFALSQEDNEALTQMIASAAWTAEVNKAFWSTHWDGDFDNLKHTVCEAFNEFYPLY